MSTEAPDGQTSPEPGSGRPKSTDKLTVAFQAAAGRLERLRVDAIAPEHRHQLYGLYRQAAFGDCPEASDLSPDKWRAWRQYQGLTRSQAKKRYVGLVERIIQDGAASGSNSPAVARSATEAAATATAPAAATPAAAAPAVPEHVATSNDGNNTVPPTGHVATGRPVSFATGTGTLASPASAPALRAGDAASTASGDDASVARMSVAGLRPLHGASATPPARHRSTGADAPDVAPLTLSKRGQLMKKRDHFNGWRSRFFVLDGKMLYYYANFNQHTPRGSIYLTKGCKVIEWPEGRKKGAKGLFPFIIKHATTPQSYKLAAPTRSEQQEWVLLLRRACGSDPQMADLGLRKKFQAEAQNSPSPSPTSAQTPRHTNQTADLATAARAGSVGSASTDGPTVVDGRPQSQPKSHKGAGAGMGAGAGAGAGVDDEVGPEETEAAAVPAAEPDEVKMVEVWEEHEEGPPLVPPLRAPYDAILDEALKGLVETAVPDDETQWVYNFEKDGVTCYSATDGTPSALGVGTVPYPPSAMLNVIKDDAVKKQIDSQFDFGEVVEVLNGQTKIGRMQYKSMMFVSARDFVTMTHWRIENDGRILIVGLSVDDDRVPEKRGVVRATARLGGWVLRPVGRDGMQTHCTYFMSTDLKGSLPTSLVRKVTSQQPMLVNTVKKWLDDTFVPSEYTPATNTGPRKVVRTSRMVPANTPAVTAAVTDTPTPVAVAPKGAAAALPRDTAPTVVPGMAASRVGPATAGDASRVGPATAERAAPAVVAPSACIATPTLVAASSMVTPSTSCQLPQPPSLPSMPKPPAPHKFKTGSLLVLLLPMLAMLIPDASLDAGGMDRRIVVLAVAVFALRVLYRAFVGPSPMSTRRKMMVASWSAPQEGNIYGALNIDMSKAKAYIEQKRAETGVRITVTSLALKAVALALRACPTINGRMVLGEFIPYPSVDVSCLVMLDRTEGGRRTKDLGNAKIARADTKSVADIARELKVKATKVRSGKDKDFEKSKPMLRLFPTFLLRPIIKTVGFLGASLGVSVPCMGVRRFPFGSCMITSVGMLGLDVAWAPFTPFAHTPMLVTLGATTDRVVAVNGQIAIRPIMTLTATIDHRFIDGAQGAVLASVVKNTLENPELLDQSPTA